MYFHVQRYPLPKGRFVRIHCFFFVFTGLLSSIVNADDGHDAASRVGRTVRSMVESDWLARDKQLADSPRHVQDLIGRARRLADRLEDATKPKDLSAERKRLDELEQQLVKLQKAGKPSQAEIRKLYLQTRWTLRRIALSNPRLDIDRLLFIKQDRPTGPYHMCDQYYGCNAVPGGGIYVLENPFGDNPKLIDLLKNSTVDNGRLKGKKLHGGFLSPEVSFDGKTILFAHSECKATDTYQWGPRISYHIFKVDADGGNLEQLTDGDVDDFDPCFLPGGRVAFVSTRRGGFLRCGRHCPVYTMFSMEPDGSDIVCLSFHETHEWQPSVDNNGMIAYSRWDYVDRDTNVAHHLWTCYPDGRDPRSFHGNYPEKRESRPWMEMSIRAVPGSHKYVATTGAHHGHAMGSLILIDRRIDDDLATSQITRLTPEVPFPEGEGGRKNIEKQMCYATAWPLSETDYLCSYDHLAKHHGIYWIDAHGNKELIYRDPSTRCLSPMPVRPRPTPPIIPEKTIQTASAKSKAKQIPPATVAVMNLYDSDFEWPPGTRIKSLRITQVLAKSTAPPNEPRIGVGNQTNARAVLGTVPVERDGSAFFEAPAGKAIYFQALDEHGMAVQSMRSATYLHPGEQLACQGCHEQKLRAASIPSMTPLAVRREPSRIEPEPDGSSPINYVRLVQPVLDRHCVVCHREKKAVDLSGKIEGPHGWSRSYNNLAAKYGFYFDSTNGSIKLPIHGGSRTTPGAFGARRAKLMHYLCEKHHGVKLSEEDRRRVIVWLDANSDFFGAYENTAAQSRGEVVVPSME